MPYPTRAEVAGWGVKALIGLTGAAIGATAVLSMRPEPAKPLAPSAPQPVFVAFLAGTKGHLYRVIESLGGDKWEDNKEFAFVDELMAARLRERADGWGEMGAGFEIRYNDGGAILFIAQTNLAMPEQVGRLYRVERAELPLLFGKSRQLIDANVGVEVRVEILS